MNQLVRTTLCLLSCSIYLLIACDHKPAPSQYVSFSGVYPHLAFYNEEDECGTGAVVPWAGKLWAITYGPHLPFGSTDKLYEISSDLSMRVHEKSTGGTHANRLVHKESNQLLIGPYFIDSKGNVKVIPFSEAPGRYTGVARHLFHPEDMLYIGTMEEGFYEVNTSTLEINILFEDGNVVREKQKITDPNQDVDLLPGAHGKGLYSGQGVLVYSNNGESTESALTQFDIESGVLAEWDGENWHIIRRNQFVEVTGPDGIYGNDNPETDPIWTTGWDHKSVLLGLRDNDKWSFFRLPKASHSYDGAHGWNTEWPRIRNVGTENEPDYLMTMHGMFWKFPGSFSNQNTAGIRPRSSYLKVIGDYSRWNDQLVFGCDDSAEKEFLNKRKVKGSIKGPGQSNSNLWFTAIDTPDQLGPNTASGAIWLQEEVPGNTTSEPFLFSGWPRRSAWIKNHGTHQVELNFEIDQRGSDNWESMLSVIVQPNQTRHIMFSEEDQAEWVRVTPKTDANLTVHFAFSDIDSRVDHPNVIFKGLADVRKKEAVGGLIYGLGDNRRSLGISASHKGASSGYYELGSDMKLIKKEDVQTQSFIDDNFAITTNGLSIDSASVLIIDDKDRRWRLPLGSDSFTQLTKSSQLRICREVATERDLFNCHGTFYELPAENADGFAKIRPIASHNYRIHDYTSYRGLLIMTGINPLEGANNPHLIVSDDKKAALWAGVIDDLWKLGKPTGEGGPWHKTEVKAGIPSDPYLIGFYDQKHLQLSHGSSESIAFSIEVETMGHGPWMKYSEVMVKPGVPYEYNFPESFHARWIRFITEKDCRATAWLEYH